MSKRRILIIDDEKEFCYLLKQNLSATDKYKVLIAKGANMAQLFTHCKWHRPDLILLDIMMPKIDGIELLRRFRKDKNTCGIPVIIVTARPDFEERLKAERLQHEGYIVKPVNTKDLLSRIENVLTEKTK